MDIAKNTDLPDLLSSLGYTVKRIGSYYTAAEMDSLRIKDRRTWKRYSTKQRGDAITFLQEFCNMKFPEAVEYLLAYRVGAKSAHSVPAYGEDSARSLAPPFPTGPASLGSGGNPRDSPAQSRPPPRPKEALEKEKPAFALPPANADQRRVFAYLRKRGIAVQVIRTFIDAGLLYEDAKYHNCVFVGRDGSGQPKFANKRGTCDLDGSGFKGDVTGSDKKIGFRLPCAPEIEEVAVFEAPIDLMSFCTLCPDVSSNAVALCGLYSGPLDTYLQENPHLKSISLLLDNDEPGINAAKEMREKYRELGYEVDIRVPKYGKDWNQQLVYKLTGKLPEVPKKQEKLKKEADNPVANIGKMIADKSAADAQWKEQRKKEQEHIAEFRDAGVADITTDPKAYARYLDIQGDNPSYSAGNIAAVMMQNPEATIFCTADRWKDLGRSVMEGEIEKGDKIFTKSASGRSYNVTPVYDITQTQGRELRSRQLLDDTPEMETALSSLLNFSRVPVVADQELDVPARYDPKDMTIAINPDCTDSQVFIAVAAEIAHSRFHDRGFNRAYHYENYQLNAQSVSYILCRRFGVEREQPDASRLPELFRGCGIQERQDALKEIQGMSRQIGRAIDRSISPPQRAAPTRRGQER